MQRQYSPSLGSSLLPQSQTALPQRWSKCTSQETNGTSARRVCQPNLVQFLPSDSAIVVDFILLQLSWAAVCLRCFLQREGFVNDSLQLPFCQEARHLLHLAPIRPHKPQVVFGPQAYQPQRQPTHTHTCPLILNLTLVALCYTCFACCTASGSLSHSKGFFLLRMLLL